MADGVRRRVQDIGGVARMGAGHHDLGPAQRLAQGPLRCKSATSGLPGRPVPRHLAALRTTGTYSDPIPPPASGIMQLPDRPDAPMMWTVMDAS